MSCLHWTERRSGSRMIFPDQFIPLFEQNGFCTELDLYMVELACRQIRQWMDEGKEAIPISVNQSKLLFYKDGYVEICVKSWNGTMCRLR